MYLSKVFLFPEEANDYLYSHSCAFYTYLPHDRIRICSEICPKPIMINLSLNPMADFGGANASPTESSTSRPLPKALLHLEVFHILSTTWSSGLVPNTGKIKMASHSFARALRTPLTRQLTAPATQRQNFLSASKIVRACFATPLKPAAGAVFQQTRGVKTIDFAGTKETVYGNLSWEESGYFWRLMAYRA